MKVTARQGISNVLFDWDGTIVDSAQLGLLAFQKTFAALGVPFPQQVYETAYSPNWYTLYEALGLSRDKWKTADDLWMENYGQQIAAPVKGAENAIRQLARKGYQLGVVSSGSNCRLNHEIEQLGLSEVFRVIVCNEQMTRKKPDPEGLYTAMRLLDCSAECTCYVGDTPEDILMGKNAGVMTVGVKSFYPTSFRVAAAEPDLYVDSLADLMEHF